MARIINVHEAKTHLSKILDQVREGEEVILAKDGRPYAKLVPIEQPGKRPLGFVPGKISDAFFEPLAKEELNRWQ
jgi:prevent-host-death family protein